MEENVKRIVNINKVTSRAQWENDTDRVIASRRAAEAAGRMEAQHQAGLHSRRQKLANLYNAEMAAWQNEVTSNVETATDRKEKIRARARALYDERKRQETDFVQTQRARQWRDASDDLRALDTHATLMDVAERRREQLFEKNRQQAQDIEDEQQWALAWEADKARASRLVLVADTCRGAGAAGAANSASSQGGRDRSATACQRGVRSGTQWHGYVAGHAICSIGVGGEAA